MRLQAPATLFLALLAACSPNSVSQEIEGPSVTLDAETPSREYEVRLCMDGRSADNASMHASMFGEIELLSGPPVLVELQSVRPDESPIDDDSVRVEASAPADHALGLDGEGPWDQSGRRCAEPQIVQLHLEAPADDNAVRVTWTVFASIDDWDNVLDDDDITVEIKELD